VLLLYGFFLDSHVLHDGPEKPDEFAGDGNGRGLWRSFGGDAVEELVAAVLRFPCVRDDCGVLASLSRSQRGAQRGPVTIAPGALQQHVPTVTVARFGNRDRSHAQPQVLIQRCST
jgi:hypothetical protein